MMAARTTWAGAILVGGLPIPVKTYTLKSKSTGGGGFKMLCPCHTEPITQHNHCATTDDVIAGDEIVRGVARGTGKNATFAPIDEDRMEQLNSLSEGGKSTAVDILQLPDADTVPWHLATGRYRVNPDPSAPGSTNSIDLLWNGLIGGGSALITEWVKTSRSKPQLVAIRADDAGLTAYELPYHDEAVDEPEGIEAHEFTVSEQGAQTFQMFAAAQGIERGAFDHEAFENTYAQRRAALVEAVLDGTDPPEQNAEPQAPTAVPDLMALMQASIAGAKTRPGTRPGPPAKAVNPKSAANPPRKPAKKSPDGARIPVGSWQE